MKRTLKKLFILFLGVFLFNYSIFAKEVEKVNIAILGYGTVGRGVKEIIDKNYVNIEKISGKQVVIKKIFVRPTRTDYLKSSDVFTCNFDEILNDPEIEIIVESMGGLNPAYGFVKKSLEKKKAVVTPNKLLMATHGADLLKIAAKNNINIGFEACVGGGTPIIMPLINSLNANNINEIYGILNGTTNFILTKMIDEKLSFEEALKIASNLGYAESDPTADIAGHDAKNKICILASTAYGKHVHPDHVYSEGITKISIEDVNHAKNLGYVIKLIGYAKKDDNEKITIFAAPMLVPVTNLLSSTNDVFNAVVVDGDCTGQVMFYGKGAGKLPTASAVVSDIIDCIKNSDKPKKLFWEESDRNNVNGFENIEASFYIRLRAKDEEECFIVEKVKIKDFNDYLKHLENSKIDVLSKIMVLN